MGTCARCPSSFGSAMYRGSPRQDGSRSAIHNWGRMNMRPLQDTRRLGLPGGSGRLRGRVGVAEPWPTPLASGAVNMADTKEGPEMSLLSTMALGVLVAVAGVGISAAAWGQDSAQGRFGTSDLHFKSVHAVTFVPTSSGATWAYDNNNARYCTGGNGFFDTGIDLPSGVLLESVTWNLFDGHPSVDISTFFCKHSSA